MTTQYRKPLPGTKLDWYDARAAVEALAPGAWAGLPYTALARTGTTTTRLLNLPGTGIPGVGTPASGLTWNPSM